MLMNMLRSLAVCVVLLLLGAHLSTQDMVSYITRSRRSVAGDSGVKVKPTIRSLHITSDIKYRYSTTLVSSRVVNPSAQAGEAVFYVTLPESAFISEFLMEVKDEVYKAYLKEKEEAKTVYDEAVQAGQSAGHVALDARDSNQFSVSVNIEAQGKVTFNLTYEQLLTRNLRVYTNNININPQQIVEDMSVTVNIAEPTPIKYLEVIALDVSSGSMVNQPNLHSKIEEKNTNHKTVVWAPTPEEQKSGNTTGLSCQFVVKYDVDRTGNDQQILVDEGYFVHFFAPENLPPMKKHFVFVLDYSISMLHNGKRKQLEAAMYKILSDLDAKDYFSIVIFHDFVKAWCPTSIYSCDRYPRSTDHPVLDCSFVIEATPTNIAAAYSYLKNYKDLGLTNIMEGLRTGLKLVSIGSDLWKNESDPLQQVIVFLTDGQPTAGVTNKDIIISDTKSLNTNQCQIFSLAFGYDADFNFLRKLSISNNAFARKIYEAADASDQLNNFYKAISTPLLSNVTFTYSPEQIDYSSRTKVDFLAFFNGSEIVVAGKIKNQIKVKETIGILSGLTASGPQKYPIVIDVTSTVYETPSTNTVGHLEKIYAYLKIQQLLDEADSLEQHDEIVKTKKKALKLALEYSFVTPLTSLIVVKPNETESAVDTTPVRPAGNYPPALSPPRWHLLPKPVGTNNPPLEGPNRPSHPWTRKKVPSRQEPTRPWDSKHSGGDTPHSSAPSWPFPEGTNNPPLEGPNRPSHPWTWKQILRKVPSRQEPIRPSDPKHSGGDTPQRPRWPLPVIIIEENYSSTIPPPRWPKAPIDGRYIHPTSGLPHWPENDIIRKISLDDIEWLHSLLMDSTNSTRVPVMINGRQFILGLNQTNISFGTCSFMGMEGECHHIQYCALDILQNGIAYFLPVQCPIPGDFLGVCCPQGIA